VIELAIESANKATRKLDVLVANTLGDDLLPDLIPDPCP
jgi:hypothetical protein